MIKKQLTLSQLSSAIGATISQRFSVPLWVVGEISECKVNASGHCYLTLVERGEGSSTPTAELRAAIWARNYQAISAQFRQISGGELVAGMKILFCCTVNFHSLYGISLFITEIDPTYTLGESERMRQLTIERLKSEGVMGLQREQNSMPMVIQRLAVVSSATAAGFEDFCKQLEGSPYRFEVELFEATMQGEMTERSVIDALGRIYNCGKEFDTVAIIRGGGSASDLRWFDSYELCYHIAQFPMPILTGIGHEKDTSVADMVAFHAFKTPTAVASTLIERISLVDNKLQSLEGQIITLAQQMFLVEEQRVANAAHNLRATTLQRLQSSALQLEKLRNAVPAIGNAVVERQLNRISTLRNELTAEVNYTLQSSEQRVRNAAQNLRNHTTGILQGEALRVQRMGSSITGVAQSVVERNLYRLGNLKNAVPQYAQRITDASGAKLEYLTLTYRRVAAGLVEREEQRVKMLEQRVVSNDPRRILSLGYSIAMDGSGRVLKSVKDLAVGAALRVELSDGIALTNVQEIETKNTN